MLIQGHLTKCIENLLQCCVLKLTLITLVCFPNANCNYSMSPLTSLDIFVTEMYSSDQWILLYVLLPLEYLFSLGSLL